MYFYFLFFFYFQNFLYNFCILLSFSSVYSSSKCGEVYVVISFRRASCGVRSTMLKRSTVLKTLWGSTLCLKMFCYCLQFIVYSQFLSIVVVFLLFFCCCCLLLLLLFILLLLNVIYLFCKGEKRLLFLFILLLLLFLLFLLN